MPLPFTRVLEIQEPPMTGEDVLMLQTLLTHFSFYSSPHSYVSGIYDQQTQASVNALRIEFFKQPGPFDAWAAGHLLTFEYDYYKDDPKLVPADLGYKYKIHIPVYNNRSIETMATLYDDYNNELLTFKARCHGYPTTGEQPVWPDYNNADPGLNSFSHSGNTPTGLMEIDFNSPEGNDSMYGPYPVNRAVRGLDGNAKLLIPAMRSGGILIHSGEWPTTTPTMPNSQGCVHVHLDDAEKIANILKKLGVIMRDNTDGVLPYPYQPQGLLSIDTIIV